MFLDSIRRLAGIELSRPGLLRTEQLKWEKTPEGYRTVVAGDEALLEKEPGKGKKWVLKFRGRMYPLPKKASFDHAEKILHTMIS